MTNGWNHGLEGTLKRSGQAHAARPGPQHNRRRALPWLASTACRVLLVVVACVCAANAAADGDPAEGAGAEQAAKARPFLEAALRRYQSVNTYSDRFELKTTLVAQDRLGRDVSRDVTVNGFLLFARPNRIALSYDSGVEMFSDGQRQWTVDHDLLQYTEQTTPHQLDIPAALPGHIIGSLLHPVALAMSRPDAGFGEIFPSVRSLTSPKRHAFDGRQGQRVSGTVRFDLPAFERPVPFNAWFDDADGLMHVMHIDITQVVQRLAELQGQAITIEKAEIVMRLTSIVLDGPVADANVAFTPAENYLRVDAIDPKLGLVGRRAPQITGKDLSGQDFSLKALRGRVVLLDFWAMWCGPCLVAMPHVQRVADRFVDRPMTVVGINSDSPEQMAQVQRILQREGITFTQFVDADTSVSRAYQVMGIPHSVLIDKKGIIRHVHTGFSRHFEQEMAFQIEQLLADDG